MSALTEIDLLYPLSQMAREGREGLASYELLEGAAVPEPYGRLLVHTGDMTSRLEAFHEGVIVLTVLHSEQAENLYTREVVLRLGEIGKPVEYGAIEIDLEAFEPGLRTKILEGRLPLGGLLNSHGVQYHSRPRAFLRVGPDDRLSRLFGSEPGQTFYGRCNELLDEHERVLARIVEVLPP